MDKLLIAERIRKYRKDADVTQDALAQAIGVSPQAVSKWEVGDGYPDITLLPGLANYFSVSIDDLMGMDEIAKEEDKKSYFKQHANLNAEEGLKLAIAYSRKYPKDYHILSSVAGNILRLSKETREEYTPLLREICERIRSECTDITLRRSAARYMCMVCEDEELNKWLYMDTKFWNQDCNRIMAERAKLREGEQSEAYKARYDAGNYIAVAGLFEHLDELPSYRGKPERSISYHTMRLRMIEFFAGSPMADGWLMEYYNSKIKLSCALFGAGKTEEGFAALYEAADLWKRWCQIPDGAELSLGNPELFGRTRIVKGHAGGIILSDGSKALSLPERLRTLGYDLHETLTRPKGWEWFDAVRTDARFVKIVEEAKALGKS